MRAMGTNGVLVVGGHPLIRERIKELINGKHDLFVSGEAATRSEALRVIERATTRLVITDLELLDSHGFDLIKDIRLRWPKLHVLVFSMEDEALYAERVLRAGAHGYISERDMSEHLPRAIQRVLAGEIYISERTAMEIAQKNVGHRLSRGAPSGPLDLLSDRELEVFGCLGEGCSTREIAQRLGIHPKTVETYRSRLKDKLGLPTAHLLLRHAIRWNKYTLPD